VAVWGFGLLGLGAYGVGVLRDCGNVEYSFPSAAPLIHLAMVPVAGHVALPHICTVGATFIEIHVSSGRPGTALRCRIEGSINELQQLQRRLNRALNHQRSGQVIAGMVLLLALCGWIVGGDDGALSAAIAAAPVGNDAEAASAEAIRRQFGAHLLRPAEMPALFRILGDICRRACLARTPDLYYLPSVDNMNAYAVGSLERSAIILTEGLLRGMTVGEITGILAHEVAHIRNDDAFAMTWAAAMCRAVALTSLAGSQGHRNAGRSPLAALLSGAPAVAQLLWLGLSRIRELDADAVAVELVDDPRALVAALGKLERYHTGADPDFARSPSEDLGRFLRSHPATSERVGILLKLAA
jgi:heat shock protein HtpX